MKEIYHDNTYLALINDVLESGEPRSDRTGTGTVSRFCPTPLKFDLTGGTIPLLTVKKMALNSIIHELLWYVNGESNITYLKENNVRIWNEWADPETGDLGPIYGLLWRSFPSGEKPLPFEKKTITDNTQVAINVNKSQLIHGVGAYGNIDINKLSPFESRLKDDWLDLLDKCYNTESKFFFGKFGKDVNVCNRWKRLDHFIDDVRRLPNYFEKKRYPSVYRLYANFFSEQNLFHPDTAGWVTSEQYRMYETNDRPMVVKHQQGNSFFIEHKSLSKFLDMPGFNISSINSPAKISEFKIAPLDRGYVVRVPPHVDQLQKAINDIKTNSSSRRIIISAWHPGFLPNEHDTPSQNASMGRQALPPCHFEMQFYVRENKYLDLLLNMRSNDLFLGAPFNIAQYSMLLHMVAHVTEKEVGTFVHAPADAHIYTNHFDQCRTMLSRDPYPAPKLSFKRKITDINDFRFDDFVIEGYQHHPTIKGVVAV